MATVGDSDFPIFVCTNTETLALTISAQSTVECVNSCIEAHAGLTTCQQTLMFGQQKVVDNIALKSQGVVEGSSLDLLLPLAGGGDRNDPTKQPQGTGSSTASSLSSHLRMALKALFQEPEVCDAYANKLEKEHLLSLDSLKDIDEEDLASIGFKKLDAKRLLRQCSVTHVVVCMGDYSNRIGPLRLAQYMKLSDARRIIYEDRLPHLPAAFHFVCGSTELAITEQQEVTWNAQAALRGDSLLLRPTTETEDGQTTQTGKDREVPSATNSVIGSASTETSKTEVVGAELESTYVVREVDDEDPTAAHLGFRALKGVNDAGDSSCSLVSLTSDSLEQQYQDGYDTSGTCAVPLAGVASMDTHQVAPEKLEDALDTDEQFRTIATAPGPNTHQDAVNIETVTQGPARHIGEERTVVPVSPSKRSRKRRRKRNTSSSSSCTSAAGDDETVDVTMAAHRGDETCTEMKPPPAESAQPTSRFQSEATETVENGTDGSTKQLPCSDQKPKQQDASSDRSFNRVYVDPLINTKIEAEYQESLPVLVKNLRRSLLGIGVDARLGNGNPFDKRYSQEINVSWLFVRTRGNKKRFILFCEERPRIESEAQIVPRMKSMRKFLKNVLHVKGTGNLSLVKRCELFQSMGPFELLQEDPTVMAVVDTSLLPGQGKRVYTIKCGQDPVGNIYSLNLGHWLQDNGILMSSNCKSMFEPGEEGRERSTEIRSKRMTDRQFHLRTRNASFRQFKTCGVPWATHIVVDMDGRHQPIQVTTCIESLHKALAAYHKKSIPFCCNEIMTASHTLLVHRFIGVDPTSSGILPILQQLIRGVRPHSTTCLECIVCRFGDKSFHVYWPGIHVSCSDGQEIRNQVVRQLREKIHDISWDTVVDKDVYDSQTLPVVGSMLSGSGPFSFIGLFGSDGSILRSPEDLENNFFALLSQTCLRRANEGNCFRGDREEGEVSGSVGSFRVADIEGQWRPYGRHGAMWKYVKGSVLPPEGQDREYKSLNRCPQQKIPFKIIQHAVKFVCGCLNIRKRGVISFGIGDKLEQQGKFRHGEVTGLAVENSQDDIQQYYQYMLDNMIFTGNKCSMTPFEQLSVSIHFVRVTPSLSEGPLAVVEIEVDPEWTVCKDNVYIHKQFEKKEPSKDLKQVPENWRHSDDYRLSKISKPVLRKAGMTCEIDWPEFMSHKKDIEDKFKDFQLSNERSYGSAQTDVDVSDLSAKLQRSLRSLDCDRYQYILVANAIPAFLRENDDFTFFREIPWTAVVDFDWSSENGGLHAIFTTTTKGASLRRQLIVLDATDFNDGSGLGVESHYRPSSQLSWIFANGRQNVSQTYHTYSDWVGFCKKGTEDALLSQIRLALSPIVVFTLFSSSSLQEMAALVQFTYSVMVAARAKRNIVILSDNVSTAQKLTELAHVDVRECCVAGLPWEHVKLNFVQMLPELKEDYSEKYLTSSTGTEIPLPPQRVTSWEELDVISSRECEQGDIQPDVIERTKLNFYKGVEAEWLNFYFSHDIERSLAPILRNSLQSKIDALRNPNFAQDSGYRNAVRLLTVHHYPGTGGTTVCRRLLWDFRKQLRCALVKSISDRTARQVQGLYEFGEMQTEASSVLPVLLLVDSVDENQMEAFCKSLDRARLKCVVVHCKSTPTEIQRRTADEDSNYYLDRKLQPQEVNKVAGIVLSLEKEPAKRLRYITDIKRDRQIIYFGLQLFGQEYNQRKLATFVKAHLDDVSELEVQMLKFCSLVYSFLHLAVPRAGIRNLLAPGLGEYCDIHIGDFSEPTADLLVSTSENNDIFVFEGYRPAHYLVGVEILNHYSLYDTVYQFLDRMLRPSSTYATRIIEDIAVRMFTRRRAKQDFDEDDEDALDNDTKTSPDRAVAQRVRERRFTPLVMDILTDEGVFRTLNLLLLLWKRSSASVHRGYLWQHIARFLAHEIGFTDIPETQAREFLSLLSTPSASPSDPAFSETCISVGVLSLSAPLSQKLSGFDAAVKAIDRAIELFPDRSMFHGTRGLVYKLQLSYYRTKHCSVKELIQAIQLTQLSCESFTISRNCLKKFQNWYPQVGESEVCLEFLRIVKDMDVFQKFPTPADGKEAYRALLEGREVPAELQSLSREQLVFIQTRQQRIRSNLDEIFECENLSKGWGKGQRYEYQRSKLKGAFLRRLFIEVSESHYSIDSARKTKGWESSKELRRQVVEEMLYNAAEDPYSSWMHFEEKNLREIVDILRPLCLVDNKRLVSQSDSTILMFVRACIEMRGTRPVSASELIMVINNWCREKPQNAWAHLFQYMVYFPLPSSPATADREIVNAAIQCCQNTIMNRHHIPRRSKPKYFVGKGDGLDVLVPAHKVSIQYFDNTTQYWRSRGVVTKLQRLKGTKLRLGRILFHGVEISFDNDRFPGDSKDWLWFYLGFTIQGPYAYDPVDASEYEELNAVDPATLPDLPLELEAQIDGFRPDPPRTTIKRTSTGLETANQTVTSTDTVSKNNQAPLRHQPCKAPEPRKALASEKRTAQAKTSISLHKNPSAREGFQSPNRSKLSDTEIRITGLNATVTDKDLRREFEAFGKIKRFYRKSQDLAFVDFENSQDAARASKQQKPNLLGCKLSVKRAYADTPWVAQTTQPPPPSTTGVDSVLQAGSVSAEKKNISAAAIDRPLSDVASADINQERGSKDSDFPSGFRGPILVINNLPGSPESDLLFDLLKVFDERVSIVCPSETTAHAVFRKLESAEAAERQICSYVNKATGGKLATTIVEANETLTTTAKSSLVTEGAKVTIENFHKEITRITHDLQETRCPDAAAAIAPLVTDGPRLQTLANYVMCEGCRHPFVIVKLCRCLMERKISVPIGTRRRRQKVLFEGVLTDMCESEFSSAISDSRSDSKQLTTVTQFIARLCVAKVVSVDLIDRIVTTLVSDGSSNKVACVCNIFDIAGKVVDRERRSRVDALFKSMSKLVDGRRVDRRTVELFRQLQRRRRSGWTSS